MSSRSPSLLRRITPVVAAVLLLIISGCRCLLPGSCKYDVEVRVVADAINRNVPLLIDVLPYEEAEASYFEAITPKQWFTDGTRQDYIDRIHQWRVSKVSDRFVAEEIGGLELPFNAHNPKAGWAGVVVFADFLGGGSDEMGHLKFPDELIRDQGWTVRIRVQADRIVPDLEN